MRKMAGFQGGGMVRDFFLLLFFFYVVLFKKTDGNKVPSKHRGALMPVTAIQSLH